MALVRTLVVWKSELIGHSEKRTNLPTKDKLNVLFRGTFQLQRGTVISYHTLGCYGVIWDDKGALLGLRGSEFWLWGSWCRTEGRGESGKQAGGDDGGGARGLPFGGHHNRRKRGSRDRSISGFSFSSSAYSLRMLSFLPALWPDGAFDRVLRAQHCQVEESHRPTSPREAATNTFSKCENFQRNNQPRPPPLLCKKSLCGYVTIVTLLTFELPTEVAGKVWETERTCRLLSC